MNTAKRISKLVNRFVQWTGPEPSNIKSNVRTIFLLVSNILVSKPVLNNRFCSRDLCVDKTEFNITFYLFLIVNTEVDYVLQCSNIRNSAKTQG